MARRTADEEEETLVVDSVLDRTVPAPITTVPVSVGTDFSSGQFRTRYASEAMSLAERFNLVVGMAPIKGPVRYRVELSAPDGPSTGGGEQSVQHIKLIPTDGGATLVAGWCNTVLRATEVRSLAYLDREHQRRFHGSTLAPPPLPSLRLDAAHYDELIDRLREFCVEQDFKLTVAEAPEGQPTQLRARPTPASNSGSWAWLFLVLFVLCLATGAFLVLKKTGRLPLRLGGKSQVGNQSR